MTTRPTPPVRIGTAGWSLPRPTWPAFDSEGSHLERYASRFSGAEINSSFYRPHRPATYARWAASVPAGFRFSVKVPRTITHELRLVDATVPLDAFLAEARGLGEALGPLLVQLPPSLEFDARAVRAFLTVLRGRHHGAVVLEPRHRSWFSGEGDALLAELAVARVASDPAVVPRAAVPGGARSLVYYRLHGSPAMYRSNYHDGRLHALADELERQSHHAHELWCIFDNTTLGAATPNALTLAAMLARYGSRHADLP